MTPVEAALVAGRQAAGILEAMPADGNTYSDDEIAAQYAAVDRLLTAFWQLDAVVSQPNYQTIC